MKKLSLLGYSLFLLLTCLSCKNDNLLYTSFQEIKYTTWSFKDSVFFNWEIEDTTKSYTVQLNIRHTTSYKWANIFLFSDLVFPNNKARRDTFEFYFSDDYGHWTGDKSGLLVKHKFPLYKRVKFPLKGVYRLNLNQAMRDTQLVDLMNIGIEVYTNQTAE